jgi:hypothetical protein
MRIIRRFNYSDDLLIISKTFNFWLFLHSWLVWLYLRLSLGIFVPALMVVALPEQFRIHVKDMLRRRREVVVLHSRIDSH